MLFSISRSATRRLASTNFATSFARSVVFRATTKPQSNAPGIYKPSSQGIRGFASAGRPKKVSTSASAVTTPAKKPAKKPVKKPAKKLTVKRTKAKAKPKLKAKAKPKAKAQAKPKRTKKPVSDERKAILERQSLKRIALFAEPKTLPVQPYQLFITEAAKGKGDGKGMIDKMAALGRDFRALPSHRIEQLRSVTEQNRLTNAAAYKAWVESHPVQKVYDANMARKTLKKKFNFPKRSLKVIRDARFPQRPATAFALFTKARWASGEYATSGTSAARLSSKVAIEWKGLTAAERQPYETLARSQAEHYAKGTNALDLVRSRSTKSPSP
ncbi:hypothetical protein F4782DRAFT_278456 [Xylaria castorea]|nr:hypothetical protein F4782DRAFT_278456 [Xylaria castorea]